MTDILEIPILKTAHSRLSEVDFDNLQFGKVMSDHMLIAEYENGEWENARIVPYGELGLLPAISALHYGQAIFEGMKAYRMENGEVAIFRPQANFDRFNLSAERMCMPAVPADIFMGGLEQLIKLDSAWAPTGAGNSLYIRPFMFATDAFVGIRPSERYTFIIFTCPVNTYYTAPLRVKVETHYTRAAQGGTGFAKCAGNYAGALLPTKLANAEGYQQILWTDAETHTHLEESGTMNIMLVKEGKLVTPKTADTVLKGITRDSIITLAKSWGMPVEERTITLTELVEGIQHGTITEAFGAGTAAVVAPIATIGYEGTDYHLPEVSTWTVAPKIKEALNAIRIGTAPDTFDWMVTV
jgi:branched-chain amino acid aminotransferase